MTDFREIEVQDESGEKDSIVIDCRTLEAAQRNLRTLLKHKHAWTIVDTNGNHVSIENANHVVAGALYSLGGMKKQKKEYSNFSVKDYSFKDYLNNNINNRDDVDLYEREAAEAEIVGFLDKSFWDASPKPCCLSLWSGRGSGKTSLLRHIALSLQAFDLQRKCGRLLVFDADKMKDIPNELAREDATLIGHVIPCLVALHLCQIFGTSMVKGVVFNNRATFLMLWSCYHDRNPIEWQSELDATLVEALRKLHNGEDAYRWWRQCTEQLFENACQFDSDPVILLDTAELLAIANEKTPSPTKQPSPETSSGQPFPGIMTPPKYPHTDGARPQTPLNHSYSEERYLVLEWIVLGIPKLHFLLAFGTGARREYLRPRDSQTRMNHQGCDPLTALGLDSAEKLYSDVMSGNDQAAVALTEGDKRNVRLAYAITAGIPRMLKAAFRQKKYRPALDSTWNEIWEKVAKTLYLDASMLVNDKRLGVSALAKAIVISTVCDLDIEVYKEKYIPDESTTWDDLRWDSIAFLAVKDTKMCYRIPRLLWGSNDKTHGSLCKWVNDVCKFRLEDLVPTVDLLYSNARDASSVLSGEPWEKMFASFLVARFYALCWLRDQSPKDSYISLSEILPQKNDDDNAMLGQVEVNLCNGISEDSSEVFAELTPENSFDHQSIHANWLVKGAHHDMILPVRRCSTKARMLWGISARNGHHKRECDLLETEQHLVCKNSSDEVAGIIQAVNPRVNQQGRRFGGKFRELTELKKYAEASITRGHAPFALNCFS